VLLAGTAVEHLIDWEGHRAVARVLRVLSESVGLGLLAGGIGQTLRLLLEINSKVGGISAPRHFDPHNTEKWEEERLRGDAFFARHGFAWEGKSPLDRANHAITDLATRDPPFTLNQHAPDASIIIPAWGQLHFVLGCLDSLSQHQSRYSAEIIVADDNSPREWGMARLSSIPWIKYICGRENTGFVGNCNHAANIARGRLLILLNSDTRVVPGWLDELVSSFGLFPKAGLVGSVLLNADGTLQESGGIFWKDGTAWNYGRGGDPKDPRYAFARQVDYCSGASIAVPAMIWREMGGFDPAFSPAYCEDADLAFRLRDRGYETWVQPLSQVLHYEGKTHGRDVTQGGKAYQVRNMRRLAERWRAVLDYHRPNGENPDREANRARGLRILIIDASTPTPDQDSGSLITVEMMRALQELGAQIVFVPQDNYLHAGKYTTDLQRVGVHCMYGPYVTRFEDVLGRCPDFDVAIVYRVGVLTKVYDEIRSHVPQARIVFHNVDLHYLRELREAELRSDPSLRIRAAQTQTEELRMIASVDCTIVHSQVEKHIVGEQLTVDNVIVFPYIAEVQGTDIPFEERRDILFLGGFAHPPNEDGITFFVREIWPEMLPRLPADARLLIVGAKPTPAVQALANDRIVVTGHVPDLRLYFDRSRVFVAPLRYGAGIKGKVVQSLAYGVPTVLTDIAAEGMGVVHGKQALIATEPEEFARAAVTLFYDSTLWNAIQSAGYSFVTETYSWQRCLEICKEIFDVADQTWLRRRANILAHLARGAAFPP